MHDYQAQLALYINGEWHDGGDRRREPVLNPATEEVIGQLPLATSADLDDALTAAAVGFERWRITAPGERANLMRRAAELLRQRAEEIGRLITLDQGKPLPEAIGEVRRAAELLEWDAGEAQRAYGRVVPSPHGLSQSVVRQPIGPVAAFPTWNVPSISPARKIGGALAAGCSIIVKASEETPAAACALVRCFADAGLPAGVLNLVFGVPAEVSAHLIASSVIRLVTFTGPIGVGKHLAGLCAERMIPAIMELGGHSPFIVCDDADVEAALDHGVSGRFRNAGQICTAPTRFLVHARHYERFVAGFVDRARALTVGDGFADGVAMGPLANARRLDAMERMVQDALARSGRLAAGGARIGNKGYFFQPTVLVDVPDDAEAMTTEPFGPLALIAPFEDLGAAIAKANGLAYGLSAYAFTNTASIAARLGAELEAGTVSINHLGGALPETPFGGLKESGYGREGGAESLDGYTTVKLISHLNG